MTYTKQLLFLAEGFRGGEAFSTSFSTLGGLNGLNHAGLRAAVVKVRCYDVYTSPIYKKINIRSISRIMLEKCAVLRGFREGMVNEHPPVNQRIRAYIYRFHMELIFVVMKENRIDC